MREEAGVPAAGWIPVDSPGPWGSPSTLGAQDPKAHADVQLKHVTHSAPPSDEPLPVTHPPGPQDRTVQGDVVPRRPGHLRRAGEEDPYD